VTTLLAKNKLIGKIRLTDMSEGAIFREIRSVFERSGSDCCLNVPPVANIEYSLHHGKPGLKVASKSTSTWTPLASRTRSRLKS
jgi:hypothetical protein